jgi:hypothetical protein
MCTRFVRGLMLAGMVLVIGVVMESNASFGPTGSYFSTKSYSPTKTVNKYPAEKAAIKLACYTKLEGRTILVNTYAPDQGYQKDKDMVVDLPGEAVTIESGVSWSLNPYESCGGHEYAYTKYWVRRADLLVALVRELQRRYPAHKITPSHAWWCSCLELWPMDKKHHYHELKGSPDDLACTVKSELYALVQDKKCTDVNMQFADE